MQLFGPFPRLNSVDLLKQAVKSDTNPDAISIDCERLERKGSFINLLTEPDKTLAPVLTSNK